MARESDVPVFLRACSAQGISTLKSVSGGINKKIKPFKQIGTAAKNVALPVPSERQARGSRPSVRRKPSSGAMNVNLVVFRKCI